MSITNQEQPTSPMSEATKSATEGLPEMREEVFEAAEPLRSAIQKAFDEMKLGLRVKATTEFFESGGSSGWGGMSFNFDPRNLDTKFTASIDQEGKVRVLYNNRYGRARDNKDEVLAIYTPKKDKPVVVSTYVAGKTPYRFKMAVTEVSDGASILFIV